MSLKVGLFLSAQFEPGEDSAAGFRAICDQAMAAEQYGFASIAVGHHYLARSAFMQPVPLLANLAARTTRIQLITGVLLLPLANPLAMAEDLATVDAMSNGRLVVGVGSGYREKEYKAFAVPYAERFSRLGEETGVLRRLLAGEAVTQTGAWGELKDAVVHLRARPSGGPDIWVGAFGEPGLKRAAKLGCSWLAPPDGDVEDLAGRYAAYRGFLTEFGQPLEREYPLMREAAVASTEAEARRICETHMARQYAQYKSWGAAQRATPMDLAERFGLVGTPDKVAEKMNRMASALGVTHIIVRLQWSGMPHGEAMSAIRLIGEQVLPLLK